MLGISACGGLQVLGTVLVLLHSTGTYCRYMDALSSHSMRPPPRIAPCIEPSESSRREKNAEPDASSDAFLEQLRDAASGEGSDEFGEDALATFFDDREDDGGRSWFNRRR